LEFFFQVHDPTTKNRQGNDMGTSYRSAIFYTTDAQKRVAEETIADVEASGLWPGPVVTEVSPAGPFWEAEPEHQDYLERYPNGHPRPFRAAGLEPPPPRRQRDPLSRIDVPDQLRDVTPIGGSSSWMKSRPLWAVELWPGGQPRLGAGRPIPAR